MTCSKTIRYAMKRARYKARQLIGTNGFSADDLDDVQQELLVDVIQRMPKYDGDRAAVKTFICRLMDHRIADLIRRRHAAHRDPQRNACSLDDWVRDETGAWVRRGVTYCDDRAHAHTGQVRRNPQDDTELALDTADVVAGLPDALRDLCTRLQSQTVTQVAHETSVARTGLYDRIGEVRSQFSVSGLHAYV